MTVYVVKDVYLFGTQIAAIYDDEIAALRHAHEQPMAQGVMRRAVEPHTVRTGHPVIKALT